MSYFDSHKSDSGDQDDGGDWIFSYADMMTLLLGFFIILYSFSKMDDHKFKTLSQELTEAFKGAKDREAEGEVSIETRQVRALQLLIAMLNLGSTPMEAVERIESAYQKGADLSKAREILESELNRDQQKILEELNGTLREKPQEVDIILPSHTLFPSGRYHLTKEAKSKLRELAKKISQVNGLVAIEVIGHTDSLPPGEQALINDNFGLSSARAGRVAQELIEAGISPKLLQTRGMGSLRPLYPERDENGRLIKENLQKNRRVHIVLRRLGEDRVDD